MFAKFRHFYEPAAFPLLAALTCAVSAAIYVGLHAARNPELRIDKTPYPWMKVDPAAPPRKLYVSEPEKKMKHVEKVTF